MASSLVYPNQYFCHECQQTIQPNHEDFTCPNCHSGFIEEMSSNLEDGGNHFHDETMDMESEHSLTWGSSPGQSTSRPHRVVFIRNHQPGPYQPGGSSSSNLQLFGSGGPGGHDEESGQWLQSIVSTLLGGTAMPALFQLHGNPGDYAWGPGSFDTIVTQLMNRLEHAGPPPASDTELATLTSLRVTKADVEEGRQCSVCFDEFKVEDEVKRLPCTHIFHPDCILPWLKMHGTCPICRKTLSGQDTSTESYLPDADGNDPNASTGGPTTTQQQP